MSHFVGAVILREDDDLSTVLQPFSENLDVEPYIDEDSDAAVELEKIKSYNDRAASNTENTAVAVFQSDIDTLNDWDGGDWREENGKLVRYTTYNPRSKWDWYAEDGGCWTDVYGDRQGESVAVIRELATKTAAARERTTDEKDWSGRFLTELVWSDGAGFNEVLDWLPYCVIAPSPERDGEHDWFEKGQMGWFGMSSNDSTPQEWAANILKVLEHIPDTATVQFVDFHI